MNKEKKGKNEGVAKNDDGLKNEDVVNNEELESLEGGVSSQMHNASVGFSGIAACCSDALNDLQNSL